MKMLRVDAVRDGEKQWLQISSRDSRLWWIEFHITTNHSADCGPFGCFCICPRNPNLCFAMLEISIFNEIMLKKSSFMCQKRPCENDHFLRNLLFDSELAAVDGNFFCYFSYYDRSRVWKEYKIVSFKNDSTIQMGYLPYSEDIPNTSFRSRQIFKRN